MFTKWTIWKRGVQIIEVPFYGFFTGDENAAKVVAMGTGFSCTHPGSLTTDGRTLKDLYGEVIARRALLK